MLYSIKYREDLQKLDETVSLQNQVRAVRLQDKLGDQNYHEDAKTLFKPMTDAITKTLMNDNALITPYLASSLVNLFKPEIKSHFRLKKDLNSTEMNDFLINEGIPVTLFSNMLLFRDSKKSFKLDGDLLETMTTYDFNVSHSDPKDQELIYEFGKQMNFNIKQKGRKSDRDKSMIKLLKSPAIMASGISNTIILSSNPDELCDRLKLLLQEIQGGNNSDLINKEIVAIVDKLLEYKCITKKQHKQILIKCNLLDEQV